jgi:hypothetical protein
MKNPLTNRIEAEMMQWKAKEQRLAGLFSASVLESRDFQKEKLAHFERILQRHPAGLASDERTTLRMLRTEKRGLERKLYPNLLFRLMRRTVIKLFQPAIDGKRELRMASQERDLHETIKKMGLHVPKAQIGKKLRTGLASFDIPVSQYTMQGKRADFQLHFALDNRGDFQLSQITAQHQHDSKTLKQSFDAQHYPELTANQVINLMEGRAVLSGERWLQLDVNDKDQDGNYRMKQFHPGYGFDLQMMLDQWPLKEMKKPELKQQLISALQAGDKVQATLELRGEKKTVDLLANPQYKQVNALQDDGQKLTAGQAQGRQMKLNQHQRLAEKPALKLGKRNGLSVG